jgi:hypothetical protein
LELIGSELPAELQIRLEYRYAFMRNIDNEIREALDLSPLTFAHAEYKIKLKKSLVKAEREPEVALAEPSLSTAQNAVPAEVSPAEQGVSHQAFDPQPYLITTQKIIRAISKKQLSTVRACFTDKGYESYTAIVGYGKGQLLDTNIQLSVSQTQGEVSVREIPMLFRFANNQRQFVQKLVLIFDQQGKVDGVTFALSQKAADDIRSKAGWSSVSQEQLIRFMEYYQTAYCLKDLSFIESVFADNALIIVGRVLKQDPTPLDNMYKKLGANVQYVRLDKQTYLKNLRDCFRNNEFVNLSFEQTAVKKVNGDDQVYGIQLAQNWYSSSYSDKGYLFLMLDLNDQAHPKIYVRSWQPEKNADGSIIGLKDFQME